MKFIDPLSDQSGASFSRAEAEPSPSRAFGLMLPCWPGPVPPAGVLRTVRYQVRHRLPAVYRARDLPSRSPVIHSVNATACSLPQHPSGTVVASSGGSKERHQAALGSRQRSSRVSWAIENTGFWRRLSIWRLGIGRLRIKGRASRLSLT
jgi:hypothetical protein